MAFARCRTSGRLGFTRGGSEGSLKGGRVGVLGGRRGGGSRATVGGTTFRAIGDVLVLRISGGKRICTGSPGLFVSSRLRGGGS